MTITAVPRSEIETRAARVPLTLHYAPVYVRVMVWLATAVAVAALLGAYAVPLLLPGNLIALVWAFAGSLVAGLAVLASLRTAVRLRERFVVGATGIRVVRSERSYDFVPWSDIARVRFRPMLQRLDLIRHTGDPVLIEYQVTDFDELALAVVTYAPSSAVEWNSNHVPEIAVGTVPTTFHATRARPLLLVVAVLVPAVSVVVYGGVLILAYAIAVATAWGWIRGWSRIRVDGESLVIERPVGTRQLARGDVADIALTVEGAARGRVSRAFYMQLASGKVLRFEGVREGPASLHAAVKLWLRQGARA